ncbi:stage V sporulation protein AA [Paenibacillus mucilaginosus]|uniref:Stage V sporulation protein AA n=1 Tax=Paenibacillus mucilaginosus (strain KNP414) TaxID=1036673 RepID=F8F8D3_PAEMK|nr:stage V sporulation protein AA [Paenibacillus mucilaginosus]AEI41280.1 Stage V sporulation protein AA [Paenibacillus mucilaginosus KNP414]MCG7211299.1 stage V sporulation protein AA [Paenibacillus mucilaginosus]WDM30311.1 stage V sporulation protein AA [Paenibacillus mucilaginosus]
MRPASVPSLYIRLRKNRRIGRGEPIRLGHVAQILLTGLDSEEELKDVVLYEPREADGLVVLVDMMLIVRKVKSRFPELAIEYFGEPHTLVEIGGKVKPPNLLLLVLVWLLLFVGSGLAIMNFHADVSMAQVHQHIYKLLTGRESAHPLLLQIPYSLGIGIGMIVFFNHLFKKKFNEEPSPLEVEMFMYQENVNHYVITEEYHRIHAEAVRREEGD